MTVLSDRDLLRRLESRNPGHRIVVEPIDGDVQVQPSSIDVRLGPDALEMVDPTADAARLEMYTAPVPIDIEERNAQYREVALPRVLAPRDFLLCATLETVAVPPDLSAKYEGRSSLGRLGLATHITAGFIDPGFSGHITLETYNAGPRPILLKPGVRVGQLVFEELSSLAERPYGHPSRKSKYVGAAATGVQGARPDA